MPNRKEHTASSKSPSIATPVTRADISASLGAGLTELLKAFDYALLSEQKVWNFAVEIARLRACGLTESDFRWLICMGYAEHAVEVTRPDENGREFRPTGKLSFKRRSCLILTQPGSTYCREHLGRDAVPLLASARPEPAAQLALPGDNSLEVKPCWDRERHELRYKDEIVKRFRWQASNQETVLDAFQEENWPGRIDDPLSPQPEQDPKQRLHDAIKCLNRNQVHPLIHFRGDGTGEGIIWEPVKTANGNPS